MTALRPTEPLASSTFSEPDDIKVAVCECLLAINAEDAHPIIPPTAINWIGDRLTSTLLAWLREEQQP